MSSISIVQWNVNGFFPRKTHIELIIDQTKPCILGLQETKLKKKHHPRINRYSFVRKDRGNEDGGGGVCLVVREDIAYEPVKLKSELEIVAAKVWLEKDPLILISMYLPPGESNAKIERELQLITDQLQMPVMILGDYNAHHINWGSEVSDYRGKIVSEWATKNSLIILNNTEPTYLHSNGKFFHIDLSLASCRVAQQFSWAPYEDLMDSNHFPIIIEITSKDMATINTQNTWNLKEANWNGYRKSIILEMALEHPSEMCQYVEETILNAAEGNVGKKAGTFNPKYSKHWWTKECAVAIKERNRELNKYRKDRSNIMQYIKLKEVQAKARNIIRHAKADSWNQYLQKINKNTSLGEIWRFTRAINGKYSDRRKIAIYDKAEQIVREEQAVVEAFAKHYSEVGEVHYDEEFKIYKHIEEKKAIEVEEMGEEEPYNRNFTITELKEVLKNLKSSAPGRDTIPYKFIQELKMEDIKQILKFYNHIWCVGIIPEQWKQSMLIPILKPGKPSTYIQSYRPIALTNCVGKIMEKMVTQRMLIYLEQEGKLNRHQSGFRPLHSTYDPLTRIEADIRLAFLKDEYCIAVFLDLEKAFDLVWQQGLIKKAQKAGIRGKMMAYIKSFLTDRKISVKIKTHLSSTFKMNTGVPQGSIISPILFDLMINDIFADIPVRVKYSIYADDGAMWLPCSNLEEGLETVQVAIDSISKWSRIWGLQVSGDKTKCVIFTKKRTKPVRILRIRQENIEYVKTVKFLGMYLDRGLTWGTHIDILKEKCQDRMGILSYVSNNKWGSSQSKLRILYKSMILSKMDYGSFLYSTAAETHLKKLDRIQYAAARIILGALQPTPTLFLETEANLMPLQIRRMYLGMQYISKVASIENHPTGEEFREYYPYQFYNLRPQALPIYGRMCEEYQKTNLDYLSLDTFKVKDCIGRYGDLRCFSSLEGYGKRKFSGQQWQMLVRDLIDSYGECKTIYTDGSVKEERTGSAYWSEEASWNGRLEDGESIFIAELVAIKEAIIYANGEIGQKYLILTDSLSAVGAIKQSITRNPIVISIKNKLRENCLVTIEWMPGHIGLEGNDRADELAKVGCSKENIIKIPNTLEKLSRKMRVAYYDRWQRKWDKVQFGLHRIKPKIGEILLDNLCREESVKITRLRLGVCKFTHSHYFLSKEPRYCRVCDTLMTIRHVIVECKEYAEQQQELKRVCKKYKTAYNVINLLNGAIPFKYIIIYMKAINLYKDI